MALPDIYTEGIAAGWKVIDASRFDAPQTLEADVAIIGSGALSFAAIAPFSATMVSLPSAIRPRLQCCANWAGISLENVD